MFRKVVCDVRGVLKAGRNELSVILKSPTEYARQQAERGGHRVPDGDWRWQTGEVRATYRARFGIEASDRQRNQARGRTSTRRPERRLWYVGLALVLRNEWVGLHFAVLSTPRRGGPWLRLERLRRRARRHGRLPVIEEAFGTVVETQMERQ